MSRSTRAGVGRLAASRSASRASRVTRVSSHRPQPSRLYSTRSGSGVGGSPVTLGILRGGRLSALPNWRPSGGGPGGLITKRRRSRGGSRFGAAQTEAVRFFLRTRSSWTERGRPKACVGGSSPSGGAKRPLSAFGILISMDVARRAYRTFPPRTRMDADDHFGFSASLRTGKLIALDADLRNLASFPLPPDALGVHGVGPDIDRAVVSGKSRIVAIDQSGRVLWQVPTNNGAAAIEKAALAIAKVVLAPYSDAQLVWAHVPSARGADQLILIDAADGSMSGVVDSRAVPRVRGSFATRTTSISPSKSAKARTVRTSILPAWRVAHHLFAALAMAHGSSPGTASTDQCS